MAAVSVGNIFLLSFLPEAAQPPRSVSSTHASSDGYMRQNRRSENPLAALGPFGGAPWPAPARVREWNAFGEDAIPRIAVVAITNPPFEATNHRNGGLAACRKRSFDEALVKSSTRCLERPGQADPPASRAPTGVLLKRPFAANAQCSVLAHRGHSCSLRSSSPAE